MKYRYCRGHHSIHYPQELTRIRILYTGPHLLQYQSYTLMSYARPATLCGHFLQDHIPTAIRRKFLEPQSGQTLFFLSVKCTLVYCFRGLIPYLAPRPFSDFFFFILEPPTAVCHVFYLKSLLLSHHRWPAHPQ